MVVTGGVETDGGGMVGEKIQCGLYVVGRRRPRERKPGVKCIVWRMVCGRYEIGCECTSYGRPGV